MEEEARLLYVGLTRARDYLVFPTNTRGTGWLNRVFNHGDESIPTLDPDADETPFYHNGHPILCQTEILYKPKDFPESLPDETPVTFHAARAGKHPVPRQSLLIDPAQEMPPGFNPQFGEPLSWASWLEFKGDYESALGKAVQSFFIADNEKLAQELRLAAAKKQLEIRGALEMVSPESLARHSEAFRGFLEKRFQPKSVFGKFPLEGWHGQRLLKLEADFFIENEETVAVILLAHFAEGMKKWRQQAQALAPVLGWWRVMLKQKWSDDMKSSDHLGKDAQFWVIFPIEGQAVELHF